MHEPNETAVILGQAFLAAMREAVCEEIQAIIPERTGSSSTFRASQALSQH